MQEVALSDRALVSIAVLMFALLCAGSTVKWFFPDIFCGTCMLAWGLAGFVSFSIVWVIRHARR